MPAYSINFNIIIVPKVNSYNLYFMHRHQTSYLCASVISVTMIPVHNTGEKLWLVTMTLFCTHGRVSGPSSLLDLRGHGPPRIQCPMSILTSGPETWTWGPVGWRRSSHDRVSRVPACESSPRAKLESDRY